MHWVEIVMWVVMVVSLIGTFLNVKADDKTNPSVRLKRMAFILWIVTNIAWVAYDIHKVAYPQAALMFCYLCISSWGLWKFRVEK